MRCVVVVVLAILAGPVKVAVAGELLQRWQDLERRSSISGLDLVDITRKQGTSKGRTHVLKITGKVINKGETAKAVPELTGVLYDDADRVLHSWTIKVAAPARLLPNESAAFRTQVANRDIRAARLSIKFKIAPDEAHYAGLLKEVRSLAEQNNAEAQYILGLIYDRGKGVSQDDGEALKWYRRAATQDVADAQNSLGNMYRDGRGGRPRYVEAVKWYRRAAEHGHAKAQSNLGLMYQAGIAVSKDDVQAHLWYSLAAAQGDRFAETLRDNVAKYMTAADISEARQLARNWRTGRRKD